MIIRTDEDREMAEMRREQYAAQAEHRGRARDETAELERLRRRKAALDLEIVGLQRLQVAETRDRLARHGFDVSRYTLPSFPHPCETRSATAAPGRENRRQVLYRDFGKVLRVY
jgi:hypothetical protein